MSALGLKQTYAPQKVMSAFPPKADMCGAKRNVRFVPIADICLNRPYLFFFLFCFIASSAASIRAAISCQLSRSLI